MVALSLFLVLVLAVVVAMALRRVGAPDVRAGVGAGARSEVRAHGRDVSLIEVMGYVGGALAGAGVFLVVGQYWGDIGSAGRIALSVGASAALVVAGLMVAASSASPALHRLRAILWLLSTAAALLAVGVVMVDLVGFELGGDEAKHTVFATALAAMVHSGALWMGRDRPVQQFVASVAAVVAVGAGVGQFASAGWIGIAVWLTAAVSLAVALRRAVEPALMYLGIGVVAGFVGSMITAIAWQGPGLLLATGTAFILVGLAQHPHLTLEAVERIVLTGAGVVLAMQALPGTVGFFAEGAGLLTGAVVWCVGLAVVTIGVKAVVRTPAAAVIVGALAMVGGSALTAVQSTAFGIVAGVATSTGLILAGVLLAHPSLSIVGFAGLLVNTPWAIAWFFPGEGRVPLLLVGTGAVLIVGALVLARRAQHQPPRDDESPSSTEAMSP